MPVLVTGAGGFLGSHVTEMLLKRGESVRVLVRPGEELLDDLRSQVDVHVGDLADAGTLRPVVRGVDRVLHCAARTGPWGPKVEYDVANVSGLRTLVELSVEAGVKRFGHVSSITVHGNDVQGSADETSPLRVEPNPYSRSKVAGERLLDHLMRTQGAPVCIIRPGWIYGPRDTGSFARFARMIETGKMIMFGSGRNSLPLVYASDVAQGILLASEAPQAAGRAYIIVNDEPVTQQDYLTAIARCLAASPSTRHVPYRLALALATAAEAAARIVRSKRPPPVMRYGIQMLGGDNRFSIARARNELGFSPQVALAEGVEASVAWYKTAESSAAH